MGTIKIVIVNILCIFLSFLKCYAGTFISSFIEGTEIDQITGIIDLNYKIYSNADLNIQQVPKASLPTGWVVASIDNVVNYNLKKGDTLNIKISISYPVSNLPFFRKIITIRMAGFNKDGNVYTTKTNATIYFTPYQTPTGFCLSLSHRSRD